MITAHIELGGQLEIVKIEDAKTKSQAIERIWDTYGIMTPIHQLFDEEELADGKDSSKQ